MSSDEGTKEMTKGSSTRRSHGRQSQGRVTGKRAQLQRATLSFCLPFEGETKDQGLTLEELGEASRGRTGLVLAPAAGSAAPAGRTEERPVSRHRGRCLGGIEFVDLAARAACWVVLCRVEDRIRARFQESGWCERACAGRRRGHPCGSCSPACLSRRDVTRNGLGTGNWGNQMGGEGGEGSQSPGVAKKNLPSGGNLEEIF